MKKGSSTVLGPFFPALCGIDRVKGRKAIDRPAAVVQISGMGENSQDSVVILGAGHAGGQAAISLRQEGWTGAITLVGEESHSPYQRPPLSKKFLTGELDQARLMLRPDQYYADHRIALLRGQRAEAIDRSARAVALKSGKRLDYDHLILAAGARPRRLSCPGSDLAKIFTLRTIDDAVDIRPHLVGGKRMAVIGAGYVGLEIAAVARGKGMHVTVIEAMDRVLARVASPALSEFVSNAHRDAGVDLCLGGGVAGFHGDGSVRTVELLDGTSIEADVVIVGIGVIPNTELAVEMGLKADNGIWVDDQLRTTEPNIFAVGDCANHPDPQSGRRVRLESVQNAVDQAKVAAAVICGHDRTYTQVPWFWSDQYDLKLQTVGLLDGHDETVVRGDPKARKFSIAYLKNGRLIALDAINSAADYMAAMQIIGRGLAAAADELRNPAIAMKVVLANAKA